MFEKTKSRSAFCDYVTKSLFSYVRYQLLYYMDLSYIYRGQCKNSFILINSLCFNLYDRILILRVKLLNFDLEFKHRIFK